MLETFLAQKPLYYDEIDYGRMPRIYEKIKDSLRLPKIIHLVGTNGKGTTGRFLASALFSQGFHVGHYSSPHILEFNERIWRDGKNISSEALEEGHKDLLHLLSPEDADSLSYFEYTTLLAMLLYSECDYVVLEAGLGGEYDATAVFDNILTLVTPIAFDHEAFLGETLEEIAKTKLRAMKQATIVGEQQDEKVVDIAQKIGEERSLSVESYEGYLDSEDLQKIEVISESLGLVEYLQNNLKLAIAGLKFLEREYSVEDFASAKLFGRLTPLSENIYLDVGHNPLAATSIVKALQGDSFTLIYNSYKDKDYREILHILAPIVTAVEIIEVEDERIEKIEILQKAIAQEGLSSQPFREIEEGKKYLLFGSFSVAEAFLKGSNYGTRTSL